MPPYFFRTSVSEAERIFASSPENSAKIYKAAESQDWMRGAMDDDGGEDNSPIALASIDFLANEVVEATLTGGALMRIEVDSREDLQTLAESTGVNILPLN